MGLKTYWVFLLVLLASLPAAACTPVTSAAFPAVMLAYLVWLGLSLVLRRGHGFGDRDLGVYAPTVPLGCLWFLFPALSLGLPFAFFFLAFPMHLAVEFFRALFAGSLEGRKRKERLFFYGLPLAIALFGGITAKWMLYSSHGGWRLFLVNLSTHGPSFGAPAFVIGIVVLVLSIFRERRRAKEDG